MGLLIWLFLVIRAIRPALKNAGEQRHLLWLFLMSAAAIGLFYGAGLTWGQHTHLSIVEYWRWWVVHLWVEGFFEVFATTVIAFFFTRLGRIRPQFAAQGALLSAGERERQPFHLRLKPGIVRLEFARRTFLPGALLAQHA